MMISLRNERNDMLKSIQEVGITKHNTMVEEIILWEYQNGRQFTKTKTKFQGVIEV
jgi:hypothetical protein